MTGASESWGRHPRAAAAQEIRLVSRTQDLPETPLSLLPYGLGRSYGDCCLNPAGALLLTRGLDRFVAFDRAKGLLRCEAGASLEDILALCLPAGFFLPVTPGTKHVTVGGAIANDVHGKNHHLVGAFGNHVTRFELLRSDGRRLECSRDVQADLFRATIGGLGLTGLITWAEIRLLPVAGPWIEQDLAPFRSVAEFIELSAAREATRAYAVGWIDCAARGRASGRGILISGDHSDRPARRPQDASPRRASLSVPVELPASPLVPMAVRAFNELYYRAKSLREGTTVVHHDGFFYPLDGIAGWNRLYGPAGFLQHQCVVPDSPEGRRVVETILRRTAESGCGSPLAVIKRFGRIRSEGLMSFPRAGITLALDFPARPGEHYAMLDAFDRLVVDAGGAIYPAKDARMSPETFRASFPELERFAALVDPRFSSGLWRRVTGE